METRRNSALSYPGDARGRPTTFQVAGATGSRSRPAAVHRPLAGEAIINYEAIMLIMHTQRHVLTDPHTQE